MTSATLDDMTTLSIHAYPLLRQENVPMLCYTYAQIEDHMQV